MNQPAKIFDGFLVLQYRNGNKRALSLLVKRWHPKLCKHAFWYVKDMEAAKDIAQEGWQIILKKINNLKDVNSFGSWALVIVHRKALDYLRRQQKTSEKLRQLHHESKIDDTTRDIDTTGDSSHDFATDTTTEVIMRSIEKLPDNQQIVLKLFYVEAYSILEICNILEVSKGTVKSRLFYAREKLKLILKKKS